MSMTTDEALRRIFDAQAATGDKFALTIGHVIDMDNKATAFLMRYWRPDPHAWPKSEEIGHGSVDDCMAALDRFVAQHAAPVYSVAAE